MNLGNAIKGATAGVIDDAGNTLDKAGKTLNKTADKIEGTEAGAPAAPSPESGIRFMNIKSSAVSDLFVCLWLLIQHSLY